MMINKLLVYITTITFCLINPVFAENVIVGWGNNDSNQVSPIVVDEQIIDIDAGPFSFCFITESGTVTCSGCENPLKNFGQCHTKKIPDNWTLQFGGMRTTEKQMTTVSTTFAAACGINIDGETECWGCKPPRQNFQCDIPKNVNEIKAKIPLDPIKGLRTIALSETHSCVVLRNGEVSCWGCEEPENYGQCSPPTNLKSIGIATAPKHTCSVSEDNKITCWGQDKYDALKTPTIKDKILKIISVNKFNAVLLDSGKIVTWGDGAPEECKNTAQPNCIKTDKVYNEIIASNDYFCTKDNQQNMDCIRINENEKIEAIRDREIYNWLNGSNIKALTMDNGVSLAIVNHETYDANKLDLPAAKKSMNQFDYMKSRKPIAPTPHFINERGDFINHIGMRFKTIGPGNFQMGGCSSKWECLFSGYEPDSEVLSVEKPIHKVEIKKEFQIAIFETTIGEFKKYLENEGKNINSYEGVKYAENHYPVSLVSWYDAQNFVKWLNKNKPDEDKGYYRLPTEAEWEYVAKAGTITRYPNGASIKNQNLANCIDCISTDEPGILPVGSFPANPWGLYDILGNVDEWVEDCMNLDGYEGASGDGSAYIVENCTDRVARGGSWEYPSETLRPSWRDWYPPEDKTWEQGFRVVREIP